MISSLLWYLKKRIARQVADVHSFSTGDLLLVLQNFSKLPNSSGASFWTEAARLTQYLCPWLSTCCHVFTLWKPTSPYFTCESILSIFCSGHRLCLSYVYTHTTPSQGRNKGKPPVKHNPPPAQTPEESRVGHQDTLNKRQSGRATGDPDPAEHMARGNSSKAVSRCIWMQDWKIQSHLSKQSTRVYYQTDSKSPCLGFTPPAPNPKSLNSLQDKNNLKAPQSRG